MSRLSKICTSVLLASTSLSVAYAQSAEDTPKAVDNGEIIVTGTRATGMLAAESAAPVQLLSQDAISKVGQPNLNQVLTQLVPSFQAQTQGTDMSSFSLSARLRGLSPNHTLVMVNGKRRHNSAILQVIAGAFGGSAAPSIDLIPPDAVQRIEILQDGAAAQYGSDAIAGVINIITKSNAEGGSAKANFGSYYDGEGDSYSISGNLGFKLGDTGFLSLTAFHRDNDYTFVGNGQTSVRNLNGSTVQLNAANSAFQPIYNGINAGNGTANINGGQPRSDLNILFYNMGYELGDVELYSFGDVSHRTGAAKQGYRTPNRICQPASVTGGVVDPSLCYQPTVLTGFVPLQKVDEDEYSVTAGVKGELSGWNWDLSGTYGDDKVKVWTTYSANASLFLDTSKVASRTLGFTPTEFYDGGFEFTQFTGNLDIKKEFDIGFADPLTFAFGGEYRRETYAIFAGDAASVYKEGGQSFPGYTQGDAGLNKRNAQAAYVDVAFKPVPAWTVDLAGRFEHFSDFGNTTIGKLTTRYDFNSAFALRGTVSTGFRAPTMAESFYSATNVTPTAATLQLQPGSAAATAAGFDRLKPEKSTNFSAGIVLRPIPRLTMTLDGYYIKIKDRIASTGTIVGQDSSGNPVTNYTIGGRTPYDIVSSAILASGKTIDSGVLQRGIQTFTNGIDTRTVGIEFAARYPVSLSFGKLDLNLGMNYNENKVTNNRLGVIFDSAAYAFIETSTPKFKSVLSGLFTSGAFSANARATYYDKSTILVRPANTTGAPILNFAGGVPTYYPGVVKAAAIFDLELGYDFTKFLNLSVGANNLFNKKPEIPGLTPAGLAQNGVGNGTSPYINNQTTIDGPFTHGPYGTNGGYYYIRLSLTF
ncbi:MAG TPA: TonB-dependent receptor [Sphingobium sp.]|uniref:TonB-dependent receptor plug domain-containing protein n=1 Tax=Sphingobium sp. TaxID=1912891 RepID=UPI002ED299E9